MNKKKILVICILLIFTVGMVMGAASASHTFKKGKYKVKVSNKVYKQIKREGFFVSDRKFKIAFSGTNQKNI